MTTTASRRRPARQVAEPPTDIDQGPDADPASVAHAVCLRLLTARARSRAELAAAMGARSVPAATAEEVLDRLTAVGLVDDRGFAAAFVATRRADKGLAAAEIARQLRQRGIATEDVSASLLETGDTSDRQTAERVVRRRAAGMRHLPAEVRLRRLVGLLARKGYSAEIAYQIVRRMEEAQFAEMVDDDTV